MKSIGITGAYGLVGKNLCNLLKDSDLEIHRVKFDEIKKLPKDLDAIIHGAGYGQPQMFGKDKALTLYINTTITNELFKYLKPGGKFLFISSSEVYSGYPSPHTEEMIGTTTPQHPRACYIEGKRCGEAICMAYKEQGYDVKIARLALAYGPGTKKHDTRVLNEFIEQALTLGRIKLLDQGDAMRTYCYVQDACELMIDILFKGKDIVYNVGGFSEISIRDLANTIATMTDAYVVLGEQSLEGSPDSVRLDMTKTLKEFPRDFVSMYDGLINTIEYQKELYGNK